MKTILKFLTLSILITATAYAMEERSLGEQLYDAVRERSDRDVNQLIAQGADLNYRAKVYLFTPLMVAAMLGYTHIVHALIHAGADLYAEDIGGATALTLAIQDRMTIRNFYTHMNIARAIIDGMLQKRMPLEMLRNYPLTRDQQSQVIALMHSYKKSKSGRDMARYVGQELKQLLQTKNMIEAQIIKAANQTYYPLEPKKITDILLDYLNKRTVQAEHSIKKQ